MSGHCYSPLSVEYIKYVIDEYKIAGNDPRNMFAKEAFKDIIVDMLVAGDIRGIQETLLWNVTEWSWNSRYVVVECAISCCGIAVEWLWNSRNIVVECYKNGFTTISGVGTKYVIMLITSQHDGVDNFMQCLF